MEKSSSHAPLGVILMNLGTPTEASPRAVRRFLSEFLHDHRVVELPRVLWCPILHGIILPFRSPKVAKLYAKIWQPGGSPLKVITEQQVSELQARYQESDVRITYAMTYGEPKLAQRVAELEADGYKNILVLPLYPQYSATTTAAIYDQYARLIMQQRNISELLIHKCYYDNPGYLDALAQSVRDHWLQHPQPEKLLFSFHGIPKRCVEKGDPYEEHCRYTAREVAQRLQLEESQWAISFQSRLGKAEWLQPYTDQLLEKWAQQGVASVNVICPAFSSDCLETLEEIDGENREVFLSSGGRTYSMIPCLNASPAHISMMASIVDGYRK
ncbi:MAG: ferrochelatase [Gammaproteobacteria bacterium]|nr:ferrochelatase [Pseudomaricurvus alcaniphilus]MBR9912288.1 ferrochelatase [Gammaproteobacteria bacterium]NHN39354.1 ferrochelatase [Pseudomaricurvus alcaniphilus]